jgi:isopentenyl-diphosphate delta-isomerase
VCSSDLAETRAELDHLVHELKVAMFLTGSRTLSELQHAPYVVTGESRPWLQR